MVGRLVGLLLDLRQKGLDPGPLISSRRERRLCPGNLWQVIHWLQRRKDDDRINSIKFVMDTVMAMEYQALLPLIERHTQTKGGGHHKLVLRLGTACKSW